MRARSSKKASIPAEDETASVHSEEYYGPKLSAELLQVIQLSSGRKHQTMMTLFRFDFNKEWDTEDSMAMKAKEFALS